MPGTLEAVVVFAIAIAPGYGFLLGYQHQRSHSTPDRDLHALAQAFICSAVWVVATWWLIGHFLSEWASDGSLGDHELMVWTLGSVLLVGPYLIGRIAGEFVRRIGKKREGQPFKAMARLGFFDHPTLWDRVWSRVIRRGSPVLVIIRLDDDKVVEGQFAKRSKVDLSPKAPRVYLEKAYGYDENGQRIVFPRGAYVDGSRIVDVSFKS